MLYYSKHRLMVFIRLLNVEEFSKNSKRERERERLEDDVDSFYVYTVIADRLDD